MKHLIVFVIFLLIPMLSNCQVKESDITGVYSNQSQGFYVQTIYLSKDGKAIYFAAVAAVPVKWRFDPATSTITILSYAGKGAELEEQKYKYDSKNKIIIPEKKNAPPDGAPLRLIEKKIPEEVQTVINSFHWDFSKIEAE